MVSQQYWSSVNGLGGTAGIDINWLAANDLFTGSQDIVVAVVDSGVAFDHPEIIYELWWNPHETYEGIDNDANGYVDDLLGWDFYDNDIDPLDENSHGTLVASLIAASTGNGEGGVGVSSRVKLMLLRVGNDMGNVGTSAVLSAFTYAGKKGANVINASFGGPYYSSAQYAIIQWLRDKGVLLVAAAGNGGNDGRGDNNDISPMYPASYPLDNIISVATVDQDGQLAIFSDFGPSRVHVAAPGTIYSVLPLHFQPYFMTPLIMVGLVGYKAIYQAHIPPTSGRFIQMDSGGIGLRTVSLLGVPRRTIPLTPIHLHELH